MYIVCVINVAYFRDGDRDGMVRNMEIIFMFSNDCVYELCTHIQHGEVGGGVGTYRK